MRHSLRSLLVVVSGAALSVGLLTAAPSVAAGPSVPGYPRVTTYPADSTSDGGPFGVTDGPGGAWYSSGNLLVRIRHDGTSQHFAVPHPDTANVGYLTSSPGYVWFADRGSFDPERLVGRIGRIDGAGHITEWTVPHGPVGASPNGLVYVHGMVWFTDSVGNRLGRLNPTTGRFTMFAVPTSDSWPLGITEGRDGNIWFLERVAAQVARITPGGEVTEWPLTPGAFPNRIVSGPDGALWFTELLAGQLGRITTAGLLTEMPVAGGLVGIAVGPDGYLYTAMATSQQLARISLAGRVLHTWPASGALLVGSSRCSLWLPGVTVITRVRVGCSWR